MTKPLADRFWAKVDRRGEDECWPWTAGVDAYGYGAIGAGGRGAGTLKAHRVSWEIHNGPIPDSMMVCHRCDYRRCCNPKHFFLGTNADNQEDKKVKGVQRGFGNSAAVLTEQHVLEIRASTADAEKLALDYGVTAKHIKAIRAKRVWKHL